MPCIPLRSASQRCPAYPSEVPCIPLRGALHTPQRCPAYPSEVPCIPLGHTPQRCPAYHSEVPCIPLRGALHTPQRCPAYPSEVPCIPLRGALHTPQAYPSEMPCVPLRHNPQRCPAFPSYTSNYAVMQTYIEDVVWHTEVDMSNLIKAIGFRIDIKYFKVALYNTPIGPRKDWSQGGIQYKQPLVSILLNIKSL